MVSDNKGLPEFFNEHLISITKTLDLTPSSISTTKSFPESIKAFKERPRIMKIFSLRGERCQFKFHSVSENDVKKVT